MNAPSRSNLLASPAAQRQATTLKDRIDDLSGDVTDRIAGTEIGPDIQEIIHQVIAVLADGGSVTIGGMPDVITTTTAAGLLGMSRPTLMKLVRSGELSSVQVGRHTRLKRDDVLAFRRQRLEHQRDALNELLELEDQLGLG